jgi:hypothetical protein
MADAAMAVAVLESAEGAFDLASDRRQTVLIQRCQAVSGRRGWP